MVKGNRIDLQSLLETALAIEGADKGTLQAYRPSTDDLAIVAHLGFQKNFLEHFKIARAFDASASGRALGIKNTILINDVEEDVGFLPHLKIARSSGFRAVKAVPVISKGQKCLGIISIYYEEPKWVWNNKKLSKIMPVLIAALEEYAGEKPNSHP